MITFDKIGISKHQNHVSIYYAIALLFTDKHLPMSEYFVHASAMFIEYESHILLIASAGK